MEIVLIIMYGFLMFILGMVWLYSIQDKDYLGTLNKALEPVKSLPSIVINDIELGSTRYYLKGDQVLSIKLDGLLLKDECIHIQQIESNEDVMKRIQVIGDPMDLNKATVYLYNINNSQCLYKSNVYSTYALNSVKATLIDQYKDIKQSLKLSETFETEDEAKQILLSRLDSQFDNELQLLQDKYNKQLDILI